MDTASSILDVGQAIEVDVELSMSGGSFLLSVETDGERSAEPDGGEPDVGRGDVGCDRFVSMGGVDQSLEDDLCGSAPFGPLDVAEEGMHDVDGAESDVDRFVEVATQCCTTLGFFEGGFACGDGPIEYVERDTAEEVLLVGEVSVQGGDPDSGGSRDGVAWRLAASLEDQFDGGVEEPSPVPAGVGSLGVVLGDGVLTAHETEYIPPLMTEYGMKTPRSGEQSGDHEDVAVTYDRFDHITGPFFHGTRITFEVGDLLVPGQPSNFHEGRISNHVYFAALLEPAIWGAELATVLSGSSERGCIYIVEPTGPFEDDPNVTNKRFPGNVTQSYRTRHPLRVLGEVETWEPHPPETLQGMLDGLARLREQGIDVIED